MKVLLVAEYRQGKLLDSYKELMGFAAQTGMEAEDCAMFLVGDGAGELPQFGGTLYLAEVSGAGEYNPAGHRRLLENVVTEFQPKLVVLPHSSYGWDLAPRLAVALGAPQISEVVAYADGVAQSPACNGKLRRSLNCGDKLTVLTLQAGAFSGGESLAGSPKVSALDAADGNGVTLQGYEEAAVGGVDLTKADIIVSAGRGIGKPENVAMVANLAKALGGEYGASRPVVDAEWVEHNRQVGTTGMSVAPKLYVACGISGAVQHLAGMKKSEFVVAINTDKDAPIGDVADIFAVADLKQLLPVLTEKLM